MPDYRPSQIERARRMLARPDPALSPAEQAFQERKARHVLKSAGVPVDCIILQLPSSVAEAGLSNRRLDQHPGGAA
ncbi:MULTISPECIES: hypothetical protein [Rhodobacterales]|uniref:hypothetical protein n=1 Tax=Rhodobacterales TaxID=204455 RepID=UPI00089A1C2B|nr:MULTISPECIES: hypothetical protein [Paracoccaceae]SEB78196.1 hypothetical protein SAMN05519105_1297 [Rhodobacter sp. 24-YEA-8]